MSLLEIQQLKKSFPLPGGGTHLVIDIPEFSMQPGEEIALSGESGAGKTTFLNLIAGILGADSGKLVLAGKDMAALSESERDRHRALHVGYMFQTFNLLQGYTCLENVVLGMAFGAGADPVRASQLLDRVGLSGKACHRPRELSVGQQQRVAVARALANQPRLVLADEPTGNLDAVNAGEALRLIRESCRDTGAALLLVSHDSKVLSDFSKVLDLREINRASKGGTI